MKVRYVALVCPNRHSGIWTVYASPDGEAMPERTVELLEKWGDLTTNHGFDPLCNFRDGSGHPCRSPLLQTHDRADDRFEDMGQAQWLFPCVLTELLNLWIHRGSPFDLLRRAFYEDDELRFPAGYGPANPGSRSRKLRYVVLLCPKRHVTLMAPYISPDGEAIPERTTEFERKWADLVAGYGFDPLCYLCRSPLATSDNGTKFQYLDKVPRTRRNQEPWLAIGVTSLKLLFALCNRRGSPFDIYRRIRMPPDFGDHEVCLAPPPAITPQSA